jgi:hypothetical protein
MAISNIFNNIKTAAYGIDGLITDLGNAYAALKAEADIAPIWEKALGFLQPVMPYMAYILLGLGVIVALFGKKLLPIAKFLGCFVIGFAAGVLYLSPLVDKIWVIPSWIIGLIIGVIAAVFFKIIYVLLVAAFAGYGMYFICFNAAVLPQVTVYTAGNWIYSLIAAAVAILIVFLLLKWIEMLGTAFLGAWLATVSLNTAFKFMDLSFIQNFNVYVFWAIVAIIALIGFVIQVKTRRRY